MLQTRSGAICFELWLADVLLRLPLEPFPPFDLAGQDLPRDVKGRVREGACCEQFESAQGAHDDALGVLALQDAAPLQNEQSLDDEEPSAEADGGVDGDPVAGSWLLPLWHASTPLNMELAAGRPPTIDRQLSRWPQRRGSPAHREPDNSLVGRPSLPSPITGSGLNPNGRCRPSLFDHVRNHTTHDRSDLLEAFSVSPPVIAAPHGKNHRSRHVQEVGPGVQARGI